MESNFLNCFGARWSGLGEESLAVKHLNMPFLPRTVHDVCKKWRLCYYIEEHTEV